MQDQAKHVATLSCAPLLMSALVALSTMLALPAAHSAAQLAGAARSQSGGGGVHCNPGQSPLAYASACDSHKRVQAMFCPRIPNDLSIHSAPQLVLWSVSMITGLSPNLHAIIDEPEPS